MKLDEQELINLINIVGQVSRPIASKEATYLQALINKMSKMVDELKAEKSEIKKNATINHGKKVKT